MTRSQGAAPAWTAHDTALWHTCEIAADLAAGRAPQSLPEVLAPFPPPPGDPSYWASGTFDLWESRALGDGSYVENNGFFFATGGLGLALTAASALGRAAGNRSRRQAAAEAAVPRWVVIDRGVVFLSRSGFALHTVQALSRWSHEDVHSAQMVAPRSVSIQGQSQAGPVSWVVMSDWAELLFLTWALTAHPRHPQLLAGAWLPPGWLDRCAQHAYRTRLASAQLDVGYTG